MAEEPEDYAAGGFQPADSASMFRLQVGELVITNPLYGSRWRPALRDLNDER